MIFQNVIVKYVLIKSILEIIINDWLDYTFRILIILLRVESIRGTCVCVVSCFVRLLFNQNTPIFISCHNHLKSIYITREIVNYQFRFVLSVLKKVVIFWSKKLHMVCYKKRKNKHLIKIYFIYIIIIKKKKYWSRAQIKQFYQCFSVFPLITISGNI